MRMSTHRPRSIRDRRRHQRHFGADRGELHPAVLAWVVALTITLGGLALAPARTAWVYFGAHAALPDLAAQVGTAQSMTLAALRAGGLRNLLSDPIEGIVALPSGPGLGVEVDEAAVARFTVR